MKKFLLFFIAAATIPFFGNAQCTTNNATDCECLDSSQQDCDLLPDITVSWGTGYYSHTEYPPGEGLQSGEINYPGNWFGITPAIEAMGRLRVSVKTPNIGVGALNIRGMDDDGYRWMICYDSGVADTFQIYDPDWNEDTYCPDGSSPKHITWQRVYHKNPDGSVSYWDKMIGTMEYHPTHGHMHFDRWVQMSLRYIDENNMENPLDWEVAADGAKIGFCVMDLGSCGGGGCMDDETVFDQGTELFQSDFPNYGLGGGSYGCSPVSQGISSGYTDTYGQGLDGMFINLPPTVCNGEYAVVMDVPSDLLVESNNNNNYAWFPVTLTQQESASSMPIEGSNSVLCEGDVITLTVSNSSSNNSFLWSTGGTGESIEITEAGTYSVDIADSFCGSETTSYITIEGNNIVAPTSEGATVTEGETATLEAVSDYDVTWYDENGEAVGFGNSFITPVLYDDATYFMSASEMSGSTSVGPLEHEGENEYSGSGTNGYVEFDALGDFVLTSVDLYTNQPGERIIVLLDSDGNTIEEHSELVPNSDDEPHTVVLDFDVPAGNNYRLTTDGDLNDINFGDENPQLKRTDGDDADLNYPYVLEGVVSLNSSPYGTDWYYYFYNWNISPTVECHMVPVEVGVSGVSISENNLNLDVYPNPTNGLFSLSLELESSSLIDLQVLSVLGELVYSQKETTKSLSKQIDLRPFSKGIYTLNIMVDGETYIQKIVLQ